VAVAARRVSPRWRWRANALAEALVGSRWERLPNTPENVIRHGEGGRPPLHGRDAGPRAITVIVPALPEAGWPEERYRVGWHEYQQALAALNDIERSALRSWLQRSNGGALWSAQRRNGRVYIRRNSHWYDDDPLYRAVSVLAALLLSPGVDL